VSAQPLVVGVVLTWNGREDTLRCLEALESSSYPRLDLLVVDNGSSDGTVEAVRVAHPNAEVVHSDVNLGFAGGNNLGIERALANGADHVLILNNDTECERDAVAELVRVATLLPRAGALCSKVLFVDPPGVIWYAGASFDPRRGYNRRHTGYLQPDGPGYRATVETDRACGAAMLVPRPALEEVGVFDEALFLYAEDTDWSLRAHAAGYRLYVVGSSVVRHHVSASSGGEAAPDTIYYGLRNSLVVAERHAPLGAMRTHVRRAEAVAAHTAQALLSPRRREGLRAVRDGFRDFRTGRLGPRA
jgi:GT2 family glycosyltransferase